MTPSRFQTMPDTAAAGPGTRQTPLGSGWTITIRSDPPNGNHPGQGGPDTLAVVPDELPEIARIAVRAAASGGEIVLRRAGQAGAAETKGAGDYVTAVDRESEDAIRSFLQAETPEIPVLAEEGGGDTGERYWAVDPLDGTTNFLHGFPIVGVSV